MTKAVRLPSATHWRSDRAVVAAAHQHVTPKADRPVTPSSLVGLSHNLLAQRTQPPTAGPPKWRSASPRQARPEEALRRPAAAAEVERPQRMAAATQLAEAVDANVFPGPGEGDLSVPQASLQEEAGPEAARPGRPRQSMPITPMELGRDLDLGRDPGSALAPAPSPDALVLNPAYVQAIARLASGSPPRQRGGTTPRSAAPNPNPNPNPSPSPSPTPNQAGGATLTACDASAIAAR